MNRRPNATPGHPGDVPPGDVHPGDVHPGDERAPAGGSSDATGPAAAWVVGAVGPGVVGTTTLAVALAAAAEAVLVEADADGGVLGLRFGAWLDRTAPSLASLLAALGPVALGAGGAAVRSAGTNGLGNDGGSAGQGSAGQGQVAAHTQRLPIGVPAVLLPAAAEDAAGPVAHLVSALPALRAALPGGRLVLDVGRLRPSSAALALAAASDVCVLTTAAGVEGLGCLLMRLPALSSALPRLIVAVRGDGPYQPDDVRHEIATATRRATTVVFVPDDPRGAAALSRPSHQPSHQRGHQPASPRNGRRGRRRGARRTALLQGAVDIATAAHAQAAVRSAAGTTEAPALWQQHDQRWGTTSSSTSSELHASTPATRSGGGTW